MRAVPGSTTYRMPGTVSDVSATFVDSTTLRPVWGREHLVLFRRRQPGVEGHDLGAAQSAVSERVGGVADLPFAGEEDQDVAVALAGELLDRLAHRVDGVAVERLVAHFHREWAVPHLDGGMCARTLRRSARAGRRWRSAARSVPDRSWPT